jgi:hypothetical protein
MNQGLLVVFVDSIDQPGEFNRIERRLLRGLVVPHRCACSRAAVHGL